MLLEFTVSNFRSIKDEITLSMISSTDPTYRKENTMPCKFEADALKTAVIYGANGSGKSNIIKAIDFLKYFVKNSSKAYTVGDIIPVTPFKFNTKTIKEPSLFEIIFYHNEKRYRYGFEVNSTEIISEWLYVKYTVRESMLFYREKGSPIEVGKKYASIKRYLNENGTVRENALLISVLVHVGDEGEAKEVAKYLNNINVLSGLKGYSGIETIKFLDSDEYIDEKAQIIDIMKSVDFGLDDLLLNFKKTNLSNSKNQLESIPFSLKEKLENNLTENIATLHEVQVKSGHKLFDENNKFIKYDTLDFLDESDGTRRFFELLGPIIDTINNDKILIIDEMELSLHLFLLETIIKMFQSKCGQSNGQLIFTTHTISLLSSDLFRRDQVLLTEKDIYGSTTLTSIADYNPRKDLSFEKNYKLGKFGAIPFIQEIIISGDNNEC